MQIKKIFQGNYCQPDVQLVQEFFLQIGSKRFKDNFTVYLYMKIFDKNTAASFGKLFNNGMQFLGD